MAPFDVNVYMGYTALTGFVFLGMPRAQTLDIWPSAESDSTALEIGTVYGEVIGAFSLMLAVRCCPGPMGYLMSAAIWCLVMTKHMLVNGLYPPPPVIAMGFGCLALTAYSKVSGSSVGKWAMIAAASLNAFVFFTDPKTPLLDTWPNLSEASLGMNIGLRCIEVVATHFLAYVLMACPGPLGRAMAMTSIAGVVAYHRTSHDIGPPIPVLVGIIATFAAQWYAVANKSGEVKAKSN
jgi:hypothetical protein